jgi:hypothetical protein
LRFDEAEFTRQLIVEMIGLKEINVPVRSGSGPKLPKAFGRIERMMFAGFALALAALTSGGTAVAQMSLVKVGETTNYCCLNGFAVSGGYVYLANFNYGLRNHNISNPVWPSEVGYESCPGNAVSVATSGRYAYVAVASYGLIAYEISDPVNPYQSFQYYSRFQTESAYRVAVSGSFYFLCLNGSIVIFDLPYSSAIGAIQVTNHAVISELTVSGDYLYTANGTDGLHIYDISDAAHPIEVGHVEETGGNGSATGVSVSGNYAYLANDGDGLRVYDVSNPGSPSNIAHVLSGGIAQAVAVSGDNAYVAVGTNGIFGGISGLLIYDVSAPDSPRLVGRINKAINAGSRMDVTVDDKFVYWGDGSRLNIYSLFGPQLSINPTSTNTVLLSWANVAGFNLQQRFDDPTAGWSEVTNGSTLLGGRKQVVVPRSISAQFYRLKHP